MTSVAELDKAIRNGSPLPPLPAAPRGPQTMTIPQDVDPPQYRVLGGPYAEQTVHNFQTQKGLVCYLANGWHKVELITMELGKAAMNDGLPNGSDYTKWADTLAAAAWALYTAANRKIEEEDRKAAEPPPSVLVG